jgi:hypothetical protein
LLVFSFKDIKKIPHNSLFIFHSLSQQPSPPLQVFAKLINHFLLTSNATSLSSTRYPCRTAFFLTCQQCSGAASTFTPSLLCSYAAVPFSPSQQLCTNIKLAVQQLIQQLCSRCTLLSLPAVLYHALLAFNAAEVQLSLCNKV